MLVIREMQIKTSARYHYIPIRMAENISLTTSNIVKHVELLVHSYVPHEGIKWYHHFGKQFDSF